MAGAGVGLDQVALLRKGLFGQILHVGVFHPVDVRPVTRVYAPVLAIVAGLRWLFLAAVVV